jgi:hypothetical protein
VNVAPYVVSAVAVLVAVCFVMILIDLARDVRR